MNDARRLTDYALGELSEKQRRALEAELQSSAALRDELQAIERTIDATRSALQESEATLSGEQRSRIEDALESRRIEDHPKAGKRATAPQRQTQARSKLLRAWWVWGAGSALAAAAAAMLFVGESETQVRGSDSWQSDEQATNSRKKAAYAAPLDQAEAPNVAPAPQLAPHPAAPGYPALPAKRRQGVTSGRGLGGGARRPGPGLPRPTIDGLRKEKGLDRERYQHFVDNPFLRVANEPLSTFSIDVDTASYAMIRRQLQSRQKPVRGAVRIEEMINYFSYSYPEPEGAHPFSVTTEISSAPWAPKHRLLRVGLKGKNVAPTEIPGANLVFLLDVSGSMQSPDKLPLLKRAFSLLAQQLDASDKVTIVVYAGASGLVLPPTPGSRHTEIMSALDRLRAGGSTNGGDGIRLAYKMAREGFVRGGINRVILATDGDFNVGTTSNSELVDLVESEAKSGVFLTVLGLGRGNYNDSMLEQISGKGNGNYAYVDSLNEARKVLVEQATGTLMTIAKDVKIQVEFNPSEVGAFRLIGYENRVLAHQDFNDDKKDAGEIGAGHTVTALYEIVPPGLPVPRGGVDPLRYQSPRPKTPAAGSGELATIKLRYKQPTGDTSQLMSVVARDAGGDLGSASADLRFASAVVELGLLLRSSPYKGSASYAQLLQRAEQVASDEHRREFVELVRNAQGWLAGE